MKKDFEKKQLIKKSVNFTDWYTDVILKSGLADYSSVKGCQVVMPYGFAIWENVQSFLDKEFKKAGVKNVYFPLFIPEKLLKKEKEHVKGFSPELAVVTIGGGKKLAEKLVIRPTSETIMYEMFAKWIKSWRDLPLMINQWVNVVRWEKRTRLFLRSTEFLWQEGHTAHQTHDESITEVKRALNVYVDFYRNVFAIDGFLGKKSDIEKFPGADQTYTYEMLMPDGKALQGCTSHDLGQNFSKPFKIKFSGKDEKENFVWQTSWGLSWRSMGALIMAHGDDLGLVLPPQVAPIQAVVIPIFQGKNEDKELIKKAKELKDILKKFRIELDIRKEYSVGWKFNEWELKGVPLRIEIGPKEIKTNKVTLVRRDKREKQEILLKDLALKVRDNLQSIQKDLFNKSADYLKKNTRQASNYKEFKDILRAHKGFIKAFWCQDQNCEMKIKEETKATTRVLPIDRKPEKGKCIYCEKSAKFKWIFAQAY
jgi:prolyl-tRNA synthetase